MSCCLCLSQGETQGIKDFISVLMLYRDYPAEEIHAAVEFALEKNISSSAGVFHILISTQDDGAVSFSPLSDRSRISPPDVSVYRQLGVLT